MVRQYKKPPVTEAVCEFRFDGTKPWDVTIPGLLFKEVTDQFPILEQSTVVQVAPYSVSGGVFPPQMQHGARFLTADRTEVIQVAPHLLSIHQLRPYRSWDHFKVRISNALNTYCAISKDETLSHVSLRYIDRVELPSARFELEDYFRVVPRAPEPIPQTFQSFLEQILIPYGPDPQQPDRWLRLTFGTSDPEQPEHLAFVLDLNMSTPDTVTWPMGEPVTTTLHLAEVLSWLDVSHEHIEQAFAAAFTEKTHQEVFEGKAP